MTQLEYMNRIDNLINTYFVIDPSWIVISLAAALITFLVLEGRRSVRKRKYAGAFIGYCVLILLYTVIGRKSSGSISVQPIPFWSYLMAAAGRTTFDHIFLNYLMFVPIGIMLPRLVSYKNTIRFALRFSVAIEVLQLVTMRGTCEIDDIIGNTIGAIIGCYICHKIRGFKREFSRKYSSILA